VEGGGAPDPGRCPGHHDRAGFVASHAPWTLPGACSR
jgi:hypothetical protein